VHACIDSFSFSACSNSLAANAVNDQPMRKGSREPSDAIRRFSSAGSQVVQMLGVSIGTRQAKG
jgi:hypothetical protein